MTDAELAALAEAADDLGEHVVRTLADDTGRPVDVFDFDPDGVEFPAPYGTGRDENDG